VCFMGRGCVKQSCKFKGNIYLPYTVAGEELNTVPQKLFVSLLVVLLHDIFPLLLLLKYEERVTGNSAFGTAFPLLLGVALIA